MDGMVFGIVAFLQKSSGALGAAFLGLLLTWIGYSEAGAQSAEAVSGIKNIFGFLVGFLYIFVAIIALKYPLSKKNHDKVRNAIKDRREGKEVDLSDLEDIL